MTTIRNTIILTDRMSPALGTINAQLDTTNDLLYGISTGMGTFEAGMRFATDNIGVSVNSIETTLSGLSDTINNLDNTNGIEKVEQSIERAVNKTNKWSKGIGKLQRSFLDLRNAASAVYLLKNLGSTLSKMMEVPDVMNVIGFRLENLDESDATSRQLMDYAYQVAQQSRSDWKATAQLASRVLQSGAVEGNAQRAVDIAGLLNKATFIGGSTSRESTAALFQLSQALASGVLAGDELRSIRENAPGLTQALSEGFTKLAEAGKLGEKFMNTSVGDLKQLGAEGELTSARIIAAIEAAGGTIDETFVDSPKQFGQAVTSINNTIKRWWTLLSQGDGVLSKITEKAWELAAWFESSDGEKFLAGLANGLNFVIEAISTAVGWVKQAVTWFKNLDNSAQILEVTLTTLGVVAAAVAATMFISWMIANWPLLLMITLVGLIIYALVELGFTAEDIVGAIAGGLMFIGYLIYDIVIYAIMILGIAILTIFQIVQVVVLGIVQMILWAVLTIWSVLVTVYNVFYSIIKAASGVVRVFVVGLYQLFVWVGSGILKVIHAIAQAIDWVFGSNLASSVQGWIDGLEGSLDALADALDPMGEFEDIGDQWKDSFSDLERLWSDDNSPFKITDDLEDGINLLAGISELFWDWGHDNLVNPMDGWDTGKEWGENFVGGIKDMALDLDFGIDLPNNEYSFKNDNDFTPDGGHLDSVGKIEDDVSITDEDIEMLKDIASVQFVNKYTTLRPEMKVEFGDVRETADVNKIIDVMEEMIEKAYASALIEG